MTEYQGYGVKVDYDHQQIVIRARNKATRFAAAGQPESPPPDAPHTEKQFRNQLGQMLDVDPLIPIADITDVEFKDATWLVNGRLTLRTKAGTTHVVHFRRKQAAGFAELYRALLTDLGPNQLQHDPAPSTRKARKEEAEHQRVIELASRHRATLVEQLNEAKSFTGADISEVPGCPLQTHAGERVFLCAAGAALVEPRRGAGHWEGRSQGISVHVPGTKSMRYRVGANRGTFVQGEERPTPIDTGTFVITSQRAVFLGAKRTREWLWSKLIGFTHAEDAPWMAIGVSNRQTTSGVLYDEANADRVRFLLDLAAARSAGTTDSLVAQIQGELSALPPDSATEASEPSPQKPSDADTSTP